MRNPNGYGTVYKMPGKRRRPYIVRKTSGWADDGRQRYAVIGYYRTKTEAIQALADYNNDPYDVDAAKLTFADIYAKWCADNFDDDTNKSTRRNYEAAYKHCAAIYDERLCDLRQQHLQQVLDDCPRGYQVASRIRILFSQIYRWCLQREIARKNYAEYLTIKQVNKPSERKAFASEEISHVWDNVALHEYMPMVLILIYSGVRISELLSLKKEDTHLEEQWFYVRDSKTDAGVRIVPIADKVLPFWRHFHAKSDIDHIFCTTEGVKFTYSNFNDRYWVQLMGLLGLQHKIHETRHTCISQMVMRGVNQTIIKKIVGHKSVMNLTERVYTHIELKELLDAINSI